MAKRRDEVETAMHSVVYDMPSVQATLIMKISFKLIVNILNDWFEAVMRKQVWS